MQKNKRNIQTVNIVGQYVAVDLTLPGKNGLDFVLTRIYDAAAASCHFHTIYGLGNGWRFAFPSIEKLEDRANDGRDRLILHLADGDTLPLNDQHTVFADSRRIDPRILNTGKQLIILYRDGSAAYFNAQYRLSYIRDQLGNRIDFAYNFSGRMNQITDTFGRVFLLEQAGNSMRVKRQDTGAVQCVYRIENEMLSEAMDNTGQTTKFVYR